MPGVRHAIALFAAAFGQQLDEVLRDGVMLANQGHSCASLDSELLTSFSSAVRAFEGEDEELAVVHKEVHTLARKFWVLQSGEEVVITFCLTHGVVGCRL